MHAILVTVSAGLFGVFGPGILARLAAPALRGKPRAPFAEHSGLLILIPAHDEAASIDATIRSVQKAAAGTPVRILVGADCCNDDTAQLARKAGARVRELNYRSKWKTLVALLADAGPRDWVALVDAGAAWPESLLRDLRDVFADRTALGVAPAYFPAQGSLIERALWSAESFWKRGENAAGGPVSVHGATVFYRAEALRSAVALLAGYGKDSWLNDDVVIPFAARLAHPGCRLEYWCPRETSRRVSDHGLREAAPQVARRARMVAGNLEWILTLFPRSVWHAPGLALVASRRVLRVFWAYWAFLIFFGACLALSASPQRALLATIIAGAAGTLVLVIGGKRGIVDAAIASLLAPFLAVALLFGWKSAWA